MGDEHVGCAAAVELDCARGEPAAFVGQVAGIVDLEVTCRTLQQGLELVRESPGLCYAFCDRDLPGGKVVGALGQAALKPASVARQGLPRGICPDDQAGGVNDACAGGKCSKRRSAQIP